MGEIMRYLRSSRLITTMAVGLILAGGLTAATASGGAVRAHSTAHVLMVGTYKGVAGQYTSIQDAVNHAQPGDWILVAPGDYREQGEFSGSYLPTSDNLRHGTYGSVLIHTPNLHLRGLNRNTVIVDGTTAGAACNSDPANQNFGPVLNGRNVGQNGIVVLQANNVSVENLTTCNFTSGSGDTGNNIWWNGGAGTGQIGLTGYYGAYLTATDTFFESNSTAGTYGIFSSDAAGSATTAWNNIYASNFNDSGMYVGACQQQCNITISNAYMEGNALGYSGTNSGGRIVIENSTFTNNQDGLDTNTQIAGDPPPPQDGACPKGAKPSVKGALTCWVLVNNTFSNNNNAHVPHAGNASNGPLGSGLTISGGRNDTVMNNKFINNGAWGLLIVPFPDSDTPPAQWTCSSSGGANFPGLGCIYDPENVHVTNNTFSGNGTFGNQTNGDIGQIVLFPGRTISCYAGNKNGSKPAITWPTNLQTANPTCDGSKTALSTATNAKHPATSLDDPLLAQALCDTGFGGCAGVGNYPKSNTVTLLPMPSPKLTPTMPNPCQGVPSNAWCKNGKLI